jgi:hypothetical protein
VQRPQPTSGVLGAGRDDQAIECDAPALRPNFAPLDVDGRDLGEDDVDVARLAHDCADGRGDVRWRQEQRPDCDGDMDEQIHSFSLSRSLFLFARSKHLSQSPGVHDHELAQTCHSERG